MAPQTSARRRARRSTRSKNSDVSARCAKTALTFALITNVITFLQMAKTFILANVAKHFKLSAVSAYRAVRLATLLHTKIISKSDFYNGQKNARTLTSEQRHWLADLVRPPLWGQG